MEKEKLSDIGFVPAMKYFSARELSLMMGLGEPEHTSDVWLAAKCRCHACGGEYTIIYPEIIDDDELPCALCKKPFGHVLEYLDPRGRWIIRDVIADRRLVGHE